MDEGEQLWIPLKDILSLPRFNSTFTTKVFAKDEILILVHDLINYCHETFYSNYVTGNKNYENHKLFPLSRLSLDSIVVNLSKKGIVGTNRERLFELRTTKVVRLYAGDFEERKDQNDEKIEFLPVPLEYGFARAINEYEDRFVKKLIYFLLQLMEMGMDDDINDINGEEETQTRMKERERVYLILKQQDSIVSQTMEYALNKVATSKGGLSLGWLQSSLHSRCIEDIIVYLKHRLQEIYLMRWEHEHHQVSGRETVTLWHSLLTLDQPTAVSIISAERDRVAITIVIIMLI
jgi:hypothetical protein